MGGKVINIDIILLMKSWCMPFIV